MDALIHSLIQRNAIPEIRKRYLTDPALFVGGHGRSRVQVFAKNGTRGKMICRHPHFLKYLRYFLYGPDLPRAVIDGFRQKVIDCGNPFTGSDALDVADFARQLNRSHHLVAHNVAEEFYKLALDCGLDAWDARTVRDRVITTR